MHASIFTGKIKKWLTTEVLIHILLWVLYFVIIAYQKNRISARSGGPSNLQLVDLAFALEYFMVILIIGYYLLPRFLYRKRYLTFLIWSTLTMVGAILIEEFVLEQLFFPDSIRSSRFTGFIPTLLEIGPTILFFLGFKLAWDNLTKQSALEKIQKEKTESELQFLKSQLNPHFLFNNLNNLYSYAQEGSPKTPEIILQLSDIMRYMLYESREKLVPLEKEIKYLEDFIQLQKLQMEGRGTVEYTISGSVNSKRIAPMILIAFVENSFKHSMNSQAEDIQIIINLEISGEQLLFKSANTFAEQGGTGNTYLNKGIGLDNVRKRLELQYPEKHHLETKAEDNVYFVNLLLDLREDGY